MRITHHAMVRAQQRGLPPFIDRLLDQYGHEEYDGQGGIQVHFDKCGLGSIERDLGKDTVRRLGNWLNAYKIRSSRDGATITVGYRYRHIWRK